MACLFERAFAQDDQCRKALTLSRDVLQTYVNAVSGLNSDCSGLQDRLQTLIGSRKLAKEAQHLVRRVCPGPHRRTDLDDEATFNASIQLYRKRVADCAASSPR